MEPNFSQSFVLSLLQHLRTAKIYTDLQNAAQLEISKTNIRVSELKKGVQSGLASSGWDKKLANAIYQYLQTHPITPHPSTTPADHIKEPLVYLRKAQQGWEKRILKSLNSMCTELNIPLARKRPDKEQRDLSSRWTELGTDGPDLSQIRPVYAPKDFLEVITSLQNPNFVTGDSSGTYTLWGLVQLPLILNDINQLRILFSEMAINQCQTGVDDSNDIPPEMFENDRVKLGRKVLANNHGPLSQEYSKKGCPVSLRADLWCQILGIEVDEFDILYYEQLKSNVVAHDLLVDSLLYKDVKLTATNDDQYFVFEDFLYQILLPFTRDTEVLKHFSQNSASPPKSYIRGKLGVEDFAVIYPPNGVIPFHGFAMYVAPLCYLYKEPVKLYYVFREIYIRYFFRLHSISSHPQLVIMSSPIDNGETYCLHMEGFQNAFAQLFDSTRRCAALRIQGIVSLSLLFETLLQTHEAELFFHLKSVGCQPLKIAFKWLVRAFSGYLSSDQVLLLWDRVLAYSSLEVLPGRKTPGIVVALAVVSALASAALLLAVSIFSFRKTNLMKVQSYNAAEAVLADLTTLQVIPLIQLSLFSK